MRQPMTITFPGMRPNPTIEAEIRKRAAKLDALCPGIISCHVVADIPHRHHQRGNDFRLRIDLKVRREEIAVARAGPQKDLLVVLRRAFDVARRRLQDHMRQRRDVKRRVTSSRRPAAKPRPAA
jgi:Sigma 54 modulation protein / S30EA ribosomal protein